MIQKPYMILNGDFIPENKPALTIKNRAFRFGDAAFETSRYHKGIPLFLSDHYARLIKGMDILKMNTESFISQEKLSEQIVSLITKNRIFKDARIRFTVFRNNGGLYTPETNDVSYTIEASPLEGELYTYNTKGVLAGVFDQYHKTSQPLFGFKNANSLIYILAGIYKQENGLDDCLIMNDKGKIIEAISSNLFLIKDNTVFTPSLASGCVDGIMRKQVIKTATSLGMQVKETPGTSLSELLEADEVFLTNAIQGINRVVGIHQKRYYSITTKIIFTALLDNVRNMVKEENSKE